MPDGTTLPVEITANVTYERNPYDKPAPQYRGEDDGWVVNDLEAD